MAGVSMRKRGGPAPAGVTRESVLPWSSFRRVSTTPLRPRSSSCAIVNVLSGSISTRVPSTRRSVSADGDAPVTTVSPLRSWVPAASGSASGAPPRCARTWPTRYTTSASVASVRSQATGMRSVVPGIKRYGSAT